MGGSFARRDWARVAAVIPRGVTLRSLVGIASTGADVAAAISGAIGAMSGPLHGGANVEVIRMLERIHKGGASPEECVAMAKDKNTNVIIDYFDGADKADDAADSLKIWDQGNDAVELGGIAILTWEDGKMKTRKVGTRKTGKGAGWGTALGAAVGVLSGGVTLIGGALGPSSLARLAWGLSWVSYS